MRYTGPKFRLCRREGINLFGPDKYNPKNRRGMPGVHGANNTRLSEYGKLLRNKQVLKRIYQMSEKQFSRLVMETSKQFAKNKWLDHDKVLIQFLSRRMDAVLLSSWFASTIMQARQMVTHGHYLLNGKKHNIPSYYVKPGDILVLRPRLQTSSLYSIDNVVQTPTRLHINQPNFEIKVLDMPHDVADDQRLPIDTLKVIEYYARA